MLIKMYINFNSKEVLTEKEFEVRKEEVIQDLVDDKNLLEEFLEGEFDFLGDLFCSLTSGDTTVETILDKYEKWIREEYITIPFRVVTDIDEFEEFILEV